MWSILEKNIIKVQVVGYIHINRLLHRKMKIKKNENKMCSSFVPQLVSVRCNEQPTIEILSTCTL